MSTTHFSGAVDSVAGFSVNGTSVVSSAGTVTSQTSVVVGTTTISEAEIGVLDAVTAGTAAASKAVVLDASKGIATITSATITTLTAPTVNATNVDAGASGTAGTVDVFPTTAANGKMIVAAVDAGGAYNTTISNSAMGQSSVISIPDPGAATSKFVLQDGNNTAAKIIKLSTGATPVAQIDPASCTITAAAGASNVSTVTVQLKDGAGTNLARIYPFRVYKSSAADGLTLGAAASTGFSVASGGLSLANATAVTTQITAMSSATGGCVLSLTDTNKATDYLVLVLDSGTKISAQLSAGSYGA